ncbi:TPA: hypothetical protein ACGQXI_003273 [Klebsiella michiganensis]
MLFGDRLTPEQLAVETEPKPVLALIEEEANQLGIVLSEPYGGDEPEEM